MDLFVIEEELLSARGRSCGVGEVGDAGLRRKKERKECRLWKVGEYEM